MDDEVSEELTRKAAEFDVELVKLSNLEKVFPIFLSKNIFIFSVEWKIQLKLVHPPLKISAQFVTLVGLLVFPKE